MVDRIAQIQEQIAALDEKIEALSGIGAPEVLTGVAAFAGAGLAALVHYLIGRRTIRAQVVAEARKAWMSELRTRLSDLLSDIYMPFASDAETYDIKRQANASMARIRLHLTPETERQCLPKRDRDCHGDLEEQLEKLHVLFLQYIDGESAYDEVFDQARTVESIARAIFYDTWKQIKVESHAEV